jgi:hypothetical protein
MPRSLSRRLLAGAAPLLIAASASAQAHAPASATLAHEHDTGPVANEGVEPEVVLAFPVVVEGATWLRLHFEEVVLAGDLFAGEGSLLRMTALADGAVQEMDARHLAQWQDSSAYFNGDTVLVEVLAQPGTGPNRVVMRAVDHGLAPAFPGSICGSLDDRALSSDPRSARLLPIGCTAWTIDDCNGCFLTAGHCQGGASVVQFNVPLSSGSGSINQPSPDDQYAVDASSLQGNGGLGVGNDWAYFGAFPNPNTGLTPVQAMGPGFTLVLPPAQPSGNDIRITGYGTDDTPLTHNQVQQTHAGPMVTSSGSTVQYATDTTGGNSGSPVIWEQTGQAIGIHTHGGCGAGGGQNSGTGLSHPELQGALAAPRGVCASGFEFPQGLPDTVAPGAPVALRVELLAPGTNVLVHHRVGGSGPFTSTPMAALGGGLHEATLGPYACGEAPEYYFSYDDANCGTLTSPAAAPAAVHGFEVTQVQTTFADDFEADQGWTTQNNATTGLWQRGVPVDDAGWAYDPTADGDGSGSCWLTQNGVGNTDVDGGSVTLTSPPLDLSNPGDSIRYDYFLYLTVEDGVDRLLVEGRSGGGAWQALVAHTTSGGLAWREHEITRTDLLAAGVSPGPDVQLRFTANDTGTASIVEAGLDGVLVGRSDCGVGTRYCTPGANGATIGASGTASVAANDLVLAGSGLPAGVNGLFFYGDLRASVPLGQGLRCVGGSAGLFRLQPVANSGAAGVITHALDATAPPAAGGAITPGSTWNFQLWFRDGGSSDLTDALEVIFTP